MVTEQNGSILNGLGSHQPFDEYGNGADGYQHTHDYVFYERSNSHAATSNPNTREQSRGSDRAKNIATEYGITVSKPKYRQYAIKDVRLGTFRNWPSCYRQRPEDLAEAGFFYSGEYLFFFIYLWLVVKKYYMNLLFVHCILTDTDNFLPYTCGYNNALCTQNLFFGLYWA